MRSRKVFKIYAEITEPDRQRFGLYLESPYFGHNPRLAKFRQILENELIKKANNDLDCKVVWFMVVGTESYRPNGFDKLCAELLAALNDFIAMETIRDKPLYMAKHQLAGYRMRKLDEWIPATYDGFIEKFKDQFELSLDGLYVFYCLQYSYAEYLSTQPRMPHGPYLKELDSALNAFYLASKFEIAAGAENYGKLYNDLVHLKYEKFLEQVFAEDWKEIPVTAKLYSLSWALQKGKGEMYYHEMKVYLDEITSRFPDHISASLWRSLMNYAVKQIRLGRREFQKDLDEFHQSLFKYGIAIEDGKLQTNIFKNITEIHLRQGKMDMAEKLAEDWEQKLDDSYGGMAVVYNQATLDFYRGQYSKCIRAMETVLRDFKQDIFYAKDARIYILMALFEQSKTEENCLETETRLNAFRVFLSRSKHLGEGSRLSAENFVKLYRKLNTFYSLPIPDRKPKARKLFDLIRQTNPLIQVEWLERQVAPYL